MVKSENYMKKTRWLGLVTAVIVVPLVSTWAQTPENSGAQPTAATPTLSPNAAEVVRLAGAGTSDDVVQAYIQNSTSTFNLTADQILYLRDIGVSSTAITAMLNRDNALRSQPPAYTYDQKLYPPTTPPPATVAPVQTPMPEAAAAPVEAPLTPPSEAPPPTYVSSPPVEVSYFYSDLAPYGTWVQLDGVGWCWQPRAVVINHGWSPYCDCGHWVYTDAGWFWQSDYSWGWAPFHYGRWQLYPRCGWVWLPDRVWGPAWVTWRYEGDHCGWAPLPPHADFDVHFGYRFNGVQVGLNFDFGLHPEHFTFIALHDFHEHDFAHYRMPPTEVTKIYNHTTIINNYMVNNNTIVNQGVKVERVQAATHTEFRKVAVRDVPAGSPVPAARPGTAKAELAVYRPQLKAPVKPLNMVAQKVDEKHPVIQHAPVAASRPEPALARNTAGSPTAGKTPGTLGRPAVDSSSGTIQRQTAPNSYKRGQSASATSPTTPAARTADQQRLASQGRPDVSGNQSPANHQYPLHTGTSNASDTSRANGSANTSQIYYPKGYHQAAETHMLPPVNAYPSESHSQSSDYQHRPSGSDQGSKGSGGGSKKSDQ
jgi:hypothetical protein